MKLQRCIWTVFAALTLAVPVAAQSGRGGPGGAPYMESRGNGPGMSGPRGGYGGPSSAGYGRGPAPMSPTRFGGSPSDGRATRYDGSSDRAPSPSMGGPNYGRSSSYPGGPSSDLSRSPAPRNPAQRMENQGPDLPVKDRIQLPLIDYKYRQGEKLMDEGRNKQDNSKIRLGLQQINQANERLEGMGAPGRRGENTSGGRR